MSDIRTNKSTRQRGYSLAEVLVATAIFTIIFVAALMIYDRSNKVFKQGVESSDMQQSTRVAFDQLASDVRMTGFDYDRDGRPFGLLGVQLWQADTDYQIGNVVQPDPPNGHAYVAIASGKSGGSPPLWPEGSGDTADEPPTLKWKEKQILQYQQPDEQLEYMGSAAITLRGNLDYESDSGNDYGREDGGSGGPDLESEYFPVVTTANDEIVTYALKSQDTSKNADEIVFFADTYTPRQVHPAEGKAEKEVKITGVDLSNANPPYTLYRYTLKDDGTPDAGTPLADNIRSLNFRYFRDTAGTVEVAANLGAGQYDGANPAETAERQARREIRSVHVDLVGMNPQPDGDYTNPDDTVMPHHRQYRLESMIVPRNLGHRGMKELSVEAPGKPVIKVVCMGSCNVAYVTWEPPIKGDVITYNVMYDIDNVGGYELEDVGNTLEAYVGKYLVPNKNFYFKVQAINPHGFATSDNEVMIKNINKTKPAPPTAAVATGGTDPAYPAEANQITLSWPEATLNESPLNVLTCSDGSTRDQVTIPGNEQINYRLYRSTDPNFTPTAADLIFDENSAAQPTFSGSNLVFADTTAANCKQYYYRLQSVDGCVANANYNDPSTVDAEGTPTTAASDYYPAVGTSAIEGSATSDVAPAKVANVSVLSDSCAGNSNVNCDVKLQWTAVTTDTATPAAPIYVDEYRITVELQDPTTLAYAVLGTPTTVSNGATQYTFSNLNKTNSYRFFVQARQCAIPGAASDFLYWPCDFTPTVTVSVPTNFGGSGTAGAPYVINSPANLQVNVSSAVSKIEVWSAAGGGITTQEGSITSATFAIPDPPDDTPTAIYVNSVLPSGCAKLTVFWVEDQAPPPCPSGEITAALASNQVTLTLANTSTIHNLTLEKIRVTWNSVEAGGKNTNLSGVLVEGFASTPVSESHSSTTNLWTEIWTPPASAIINTSESGFPIQFNFNLPGNQKLPLNPIKSICVQYKGQQGDVIVCGFTLPGPLPGICTIP